MFFFVWILCYGISLKGLFVFLGIERFLIINWYNFILFKLWGFVIILDVDKFVFKMMLLENLILDILRIKLFLVLFV